MTFSVWMLALAVFLSGAAAAVFVALVIGIHIGDRARHLADEPGAHLDALPAACWALACAPATPQAIAAPKGMTSACP